MPVCHRYFFCLRPPFTVARRIGLLRDYVNRGGDVVTNDRLHMTLAITPDYPQPQPRVAAALRAIGGTGDAGPFGVSLDRISGGYEVIALRPSRPPAELRRLQRHLDHRLTAASLRRENWSFNPHVTLLYRKDDPFVRSVQPFEWLATELVLIHSIVGATQHIELGRWPLVSPQLSLAL
jgi:2'-5' RNA ligase